MPHAVAWVPLQRQGRPRIWGWHSPTQKNVPQHHINPKPSSKPQKMDWRLRTSKLPQGLTWIAAMRCNPAAVLQHPPPCDGLPRISAKRVPSAARARAFCCCGRPQPASWFANSLPSNPAQGTSLSLLIRRVADYGFSRGAARGLGGARAVGAACPGSGGALVRCACTGMLARRLGFGRLIAAGARARTRYRCGRGGLAGARRPHLVWRCWVGAVLGGLSGGVTGSSPVGLDFGARGVAPGWHGPPRACWRPVVVHASGCFLHGLQPATVTHAPDAPIRIAGCSP
jgi:hypothetical protein